MTEQPANIAREARSIHQPLKESLNSKGPFDKDVDFQRKNLRRRYLNLMLVYPNSKEAKDVENHLWMQTSHQFIDSYRRSLVKLENQQQQRQQQQQQQAEQQAQQTTPGRQQNSVVEHRKLLQRFQKFLADEEKFWTQLILRIRRLFDLQEAEEALLAVGLLSNGHDVDMPDARDAGMQGTNGRNHFQFPPEDPGVTFSPTTPEERQSRLSTLTKALICLGDIARYRELYNESNGRPRAGQQDGGPSRRGRNRRGGGETSTRPRNYDKARQFYEQARLLLPHDGNPSHQLAIISSYQKDYFSSIIHYYRSLCVRQPYDTASDNLANVLTKALELCKQQQQRAKRGRDKALDPLGPRARVDSLKENIVVIHAIWRESLEKGIGKMKSVAPDLPKKIFQQFHSLLHDKHLPIDTIYNVIVLSEAALWKYRMFRDLGSSSAQSKGAEHAPPPPETSTIVEWRILEHLLDMHRCILEVGKDELQDPLASEGPSDDLAQRISATFRRTLPALRIASKWLVANFSYVMKDKEFLAFQANQRDRKPDMKEDTNKISRHSRKTIEFWKTYSQFILLLSQRFPSEKLPRPSIPLEEDVELRGFLPLKNLMGEDSQSSPSHRSEARNMVHPNEEQLMRIAGMLEDARAIAEMENSPLGVFHGRVLLKPEMVVQEGAANRSRPEISREVQPASPIRKDHTMAAKPDTSMEFVQSTILDDDELSETGSLTDDDPVREIFDLVLRDGEDDDDDDDEKEEIVWNPRATTSPQFSPDLQAAPATPVKPMMNPTNLSPRSPTGPSHFSQRAASFGSSSKQGSTSVPAPAPAATTAQDILSNLMGFKPKQVVSPPVMAEPGPVQSTLLFGGERSGHINQPNHSIWAGFQDEQAHPQPAGNMNTLNSSHTSPLYQRQYPMAPLHQEPHLQQPSWPPHFPSQSQERSIGLNPPSNSYNHPLPPFHSNNGQHHHRLPSSGVSTLSPQLFNTPQPSTYPFGHAAHPPPIQRLEQHQRSPYHPSSSAPFTTSPPGLQRPIGSQNHYYSSGGGAYPVQAPSMLEHQPHAPQATYMSPMMSQNWGHTR